MCGVGCRRGGGGGHATAHFYENLTKEMFVNILQGFLLPAAQVLYESYRGKVYKTMASAQKNLHMLDWLSHSPDLNPIKNIWWQMKQQLYQKAITDVGEMERKSTKVWDAMTDDFL